MLLFDMFNIEFELNTPIVPLEPELFSTLIVSPPPKTAFWFAGVALADIEADSSEKVPIGGNEFEGVIGSRLAEGGLPWPLKNISRWL